MLRIERAAGATVVVSRLAKPRVLAVLSIALAAAALAVVRSSVRAAGVLAAAAVLMAALGGRAVRARFERGRVRVRQALPFHATSDRPLSEFAGARIETVREARRRRAERLARDWRARSGREMPGWMIRGDAPGANDQLRRIVLVARAGEALPVTAWVAEEDLEPALVEIEALLSR
jgi:hypothetical protein